MKFSLNSILSGFNLSAINDRFKKIEEELNEKVLYRVNPEGEPNMMQQDLDMNGYRIVNSAGLIVEGSAEPAILAPRPIGDVAEVGIGLRYAREDHVHTGLVGATGPAGTSNAIIYAYQRSATKPTGLPGPITYNFAQAKITVPNTVALANGWSKIIPDGTNQLWITACSASANAGEDTVENSEWTDPALMAQGGINTATIYIYKRTTVGTAPVLPNIDVVYTFAQGLVANLTNGWTPAIPDIAQGDFLWVSTATAASSQGVDTIPPNEWAAPQIFSKKGEPGAPGANGGISNAVVYAYQRNVNTPSGTPGAVTYTFASASITSPDTLPNAWAKTIPAGNDPLWVTTASASAAFSTDDIAANEWSTPVKLSTNGVNGLNTATVYIYQRNATGATPSKPTASSTYSFATRTLTGLNNGWSFTIPADSLGQFLFVSTATASTLDITDAIAPTEWADVQLLSKNGTNGSNGLAGSNGVRGTVTVARAISGSAWSNTEANAAIAAAGYGDPVNRDIVTLYNTAVGFSETRFRDGGSWLALTSYINGNMLVSGTLSANKISGGTFSGASISIESAGLGPLLSVGYLGNTVGYRRLNGYNIDAGALADPSAPSIKGTGIAEVGVHGEGGTYQTSHGVRGVGRSSAGTKVSSGLVGENSGRAFYAEIGGYGPFTGSHDVLFQSGTKIEQGDIVVDVECVNRQDVSNTIFEICPSVFPNQKAAIGVFVDSLGSLVERSPAALPKGSQLHNLIAYKYNLGTVNAVGEGMLNVCGEGGDIEAGDLIVTSSVPGKGMKQADDIVRSYTVARAREAATFKPGEHKQIACIYLCG